MAQRTWIGIASTALGLVITGALTTPLWAAAPEVVASAERPLVVEAAGPGAGGQPSADSAACARRSERPTSPSSDSGAHAAPAPRAATTAAAEVQQSVSVIVPPTAIVHLDGDGRVVAAMTNTGCAPAAGDDLYVSSPGRTDLERAAWETVADHDWLGDFSLPGVFVPQSVD